MKMVKRIPFYVIITIFAAAIGTLSPRPAAGQEVLQAEVDIKPETLNLKSKGNWITCFVGAPAGYTAEDIVGESVIISDIGGNTVNIKPVRYGIVEDDDEGDSDLMLKYSRPEVQNVMIENSLKGKVDITVTGVLADTTPFAGIATIKVKPPKK